jgi:hypothetical protein
LGYQTTHFVNSNHLLSSPLKHLILIFA